MNYKRISEKAINCMRLMSLIWTIVYVIAAVVTMAIILSNGVHVANFVYIILAAFLLLFIIYTIVSPVIRHRRYRYYIDDDMLVVVEGLFFITKSIAPIERIHQIAVKRGPIDRLYKMSNVVVTTAGGQVKIGFLEDEVAEEIAERLRNRINGIAKAEKLEDAEEDAHE